LDYSVFSKLRNMLSIRYCVLLNAKALFFASWPELVCSADGRISQHSTHQPLKEKRKGFQNPHASSFLSHRWCCCHSKEVLAIVYVVVVVVVVYKCQFWQGINARGFGGWLWTRVRGGWWQQWDWKDNDTITDTAKKAISTATAIASKAANQVRMAVTITAGWWWCFIYQLSCWFSYQFAFVGVSTEEEKEEVNDNDDVLLMLILFLCFLPTCPSWAWWKCRERDGKQWRRYFSWVDAVVVFLLTCHWCDWQVVEKEMGNEDNVFTSCCCLCVLLTGYFPVVAFLLTYHCCKWHTVAKEADKWGQCFYELLLFLCPSDCFFAWGCRGERGGQWQNDVCWTQWCCCVFYGMSLLQSMWRQRKEDDNYVDEDDYVFYKLMLLLLLLCVIWTFTCCIATEDETESGNDEDVFWTKYCCISYQSCH